MISVKRKDIATIRAILDKTGNDGLSERQRSIGHFTKSDPKKKPTFKAYKKQLVKNELNRMFNKKCAYCESRYAHVSPMDVEHFRPKGAYLMPDGKKSDNGYYWLAAEWTNLLPSCIDCNRERKQFRKSDGKLIKSKSGKANKFPIIDENKRAKKANEEKNEIPLLLDPCVDNPAQYLEFMDDGSVRSKNSSKEKKLPKGQNSIEVFGFDRFDLLRERQITMERLKSQMNDVCSYLLNTMENPGKTRHIANLDRAKKELKSYATKESTYLALVKPMIRYFNKVLRDSEEYLDLKVQLLADPDNITIQNNLEQIFTKIAVNARDQKPASNIVKSVVEWMELLD